MAQWTSHQLQEQKIVGSNPTTELGFWGKHCNAVVYMMEIICIFTVLKKINKYIAPKIHIKTTQFWDPL
jgi:hypothetical protein